MKMALQLDNYPTIIRFHLLNRLSSKPTFAFGITIFLLLGTPLYWLVWVA